MTISLYDRVENNVGKEENAGCLHFLLFQQCFPKTFFFRVVISLYDRVENNVGKEGNAGYQHFFLFPQFFPKPSSLGLLKDGIVW